MVPLGTQNETAVTTIQPYVGAIVARSIVQVASGQCGIGFDGATADQLTCLVQAVENGIRAFLADANKADECVASLRQALNVAAAEEQMLAEQKLIVEINEEYDIVTARGECRDLCARIGFPGSEQVKIATVVSELARNIVQYVGRGKIELIAIQLPHKGIEIIAMDEGTGIPDVDLVLSGDYKSRTGMGVGLVGTKRLMDDFDVQSGPTGTRIMTRKYTL